jgi:repressor LexA
LLFSPRPLFFKDEITLMCANLMKNKNATLKRFYKTKDGVEFRSSNPLMEPIIVKSGDVNILGVVVGLFRKY